MNVIGASILTTLMACVFFAPRRWALLAMMAGILYLPLGLRIEVLGLNLFSMRFMEVACFTRVVIKKEFSLKRLNNIDIAFFLLYVYLITVSLLRPSDLSANKIAIPLDAMLCYFAFRGLVGSVEEFKWFLRALVIVLVPFVFLVVVERLTGHNVFAFFGGGPIEGFTRNDKIRCFGSFQHPSLLGTVGATLLPLYVGLAFFRAERVRAVLALVLCLVIVWASNSGGPLQATAFALVGWLFWKIRTQMQKVRWGIVGFLILLQMVMNAPIWYLIARLGSISGGDAWHRSYLIDIALQRFSEWWVLGIPMSDTIDWFPHSLESTGGADVTNLYIAFGLKGGVGAVILFILLLTRSFSMLGRALEQVRADSGRPRNPEFFLWGMGVMLSVHVVNWLGITYFDQTYALWFMQLATISNLSEQCLNAFPLKERQPAPGERTRTRERNGVAGLSRDRVPRSLCVCGTTCVDQLGSYSRHT